MPIYKIKLLSPNLGLILKNFHGEWEQNDVLEMNPLLFFNESPAIKPKYFWKPLLDHPKFYFIPKSHKRLSNIPGRPAISNCGTPTKKVSKFLDNHLQPLMRKALSYIKYSGDSINKIWRMTSRPDNAIFVTADVMALYPSIPHNFELKALREVLDKGEQKNNSYWRIGSNDRVCIEKQLPWI